ncbi:hypothetical protein ACWD5R_11190 [Streptomyces sp. NPDC002514]|uniref:hypothetical protein n=1 Tax=unclassified Streptomyces TaxID=2593676 RepID=UPI0036CB2B83
MTVPDTRTGVLVIRVWWEPGQTPALRARLLVADSALHPPVVYATAAGPDDVCRQVAAWLQRWTESITAPGE